MAAIPKVTSQELIDLGLMNLEREFIVPRFLQGRADDMTLLEMIAEMKLRRDPLFRALLDGSYVAKH